MMVTCLGGEGSVGLRVYSNCRSYYYLQFTLSIYSEYVQMHTLYYYSHGAMNKTDLEI